VQLLRLVTLHPALVHYTLGTLPLLVLAYGLARLRHSERWTFVGDVTLWVTTAFTVLTGATGLLSFLTLRWPGGVDPWPWVHLGAGVSVAAFLIVLSYLRARARRAHRPGEAPQIVRRGSLALAVVTLGLSVIAGWIGGELLVFRAGMAVQAAADGALAPPVPAPMRKPPRKVMDAMHAIRPAWGSASTALAAMIADRPTDAAFGAIAEGARTIEETSAWMEHDGPKTLEEGHGMGHPRLGVGGGPPPSGEGDASAPETLARWSEELGVRARALREAAEGRDLPAATKAAGQMQTACVGCHEELRWRH
jgi:uncharacterized membrane protein